MADLLTGFLSPIRERVVRDQSLCLEIRSDYINVYYRGGNALMLRRSAAGYSASFDTKYFSGPVPSMPPPLVSCSADVAAWLHAVPMLKQAIELAQPGEERDIQQLLVRDKNYGGIARSTDYYVCDIEYANREGRLDLIGLRWCYRRAVSGTVGSWGGGYLGGLVGGTAGLWGGAKSGAAVGTLFGGPGIGTAAGGAIGAVVGTLLGGLLGATGGREVLESVYGVRTRSSHDVGLQFWGVAR